MAERTADRIEPGPPPTDGDADLAPDVWGFKDTAFTVLPNGRAMLTGARYALSGIELPDLIPWVRATLGTDFSESATARGAYPPPVPAPTLSDGFVRAAKGIVGEKGFSLDPLARLRRGHGHTLDEMYAIKHEGITRIPDAILFPASNDEVRRIVLAAAAHEVCLVPYGGGTSVTEALRCPLDETRMIVSVDLGRMNRILWIDRVNRTACIQAGAVGRHITSQLAEHGFTLGHEPDSYEFSTLGGWIATNASGMKKNRYGNIEDIVMDIEVVTAAGEVSRATRTPRESIGPDPRRWVLGSEGTMGIITQAVVKVFPLPEVVEHDAMLFKSFEIGVAFLHDLSRSGEVPASVRLVDNLQFQLSQTLKGPAEGLAALKRRAEKYVVTKVKGFDPTAMVALTLLFEGTAAQVARQRSVIAELAAKHGGMRAGASNGEKGYQLTFGIAYLRDFVLKHGVMGESFETAVEWTNVLALCTGVKRRIAEECAARGVPGRPFVTCRVTQVYQTGVCVYFYLGLSDEGLAHPLETYGALEAAARDEILTRGGSLSHHHGIGKRRQRFLSRVLSPAALEWARAVKTTTDPRNIFGIGNL